jgi:hypothetical protein
MTVRLRFVMAPFRTMSRPARALSRGRHTHRAQEAILAIGGNSYIRPLDGVLCCRHKRSYQPRCLHTPLSFAGLIFFSRHLTR